MPLNEPAIDASIVSTFKVTASDLANYLSVEPTDSFPSVLATSRLVAYMEITSARILRTCLAVGEVSVGVSINVVHSAATPRSAKVTVESKYTGREGKLFVFEILANDDGGPIGKATHKRAIVTTKRLEGEAKKRIKEAVKLAGNTADANTSESI